MLPVYGVLPRKIFKIFKKVPKSILYRKPRHNGLTLFLSGCVKFGDFLRNPIFDKKGKQTPKAFLRFWDFRVFRRGHGKGRWTRIGPWKLIKIKSPLKVPLKIILRDFKAKDDSKWRIANFFKKILKIF